MLGFILCFSLLLICLLMLGDQVKIPTFADQAQKPEGLNILSFQFADRLNGLRLYVKRWIEGASRFLFSLVLTFYRFSGVHKSPLKRISYFGQSVQFKMLMLFGRGILRT